MIVNRKKNKPLTRGKGLRKTKPKPLTRGTGLQNKTTPRPLTRGLGLKNERFNKLENEVAQ